MFSASVSGIKTYGPSALAFVIVALLAGILVERRILTPHAAPQNSVLAGVPLVAHNDSALPDLRRIVLDPCTGLEKAQIAQPAPPLAAKAD